MLQQMLPRQRLPEAGLSVIGIWVAARLEVFRLPVDVLSPTGADYFEATLKMVEQVPRAARRSDHMLV